MKRMIYVYEEGARGWGQDAFTTLNPTEFLETLKKSGSRLVEIQTDLPKPVPPSPSALAAPNTLQAVYNLRFLPGTQHLGKAVSQLLTSEYVGSGQYQTLLRSLAGLAEAYDRLRQELHYIPISELRLADEAVAGKK